MAQIEHVPATVRKLVGVVTVFGARSPEIRRRLETERPPGADWSGFRGGSEAERIGLEAVLMKSGIHGEDDRRGRTGIRAKPENIDFRLANELLK